MLDIDAAHYSKGASRKMKSNQVPVLQLTFNFKKNTFLLLDETYFWASTHQRQGKEKVQNVAVYYNIEAS